MLVWPPPSIRHDTALSTVSSAEAIETFAEPTANESADVAGAAGADEQPTSINVAVTATTKGPGHR
ncbi:hypothetical protein A5776_01855 [Mycolicibacterium elephantis]|nr:hypothetical protein A5762_03415 [Mycolicibacterium elephantis]OBE95260.1 hypothetical protein A5776_01855 [Mycolicibacterium elephantis]